MLKEEMHKGQTCPLCGSIYFEASALSRKDNKTAICPDCGIRQSLESIGVSKAEQDEILCTIHNCIRK